MDTYGGEDMIITTAARDIELVPRLNKTVCLIFDNDDGEMKARSAGGGTSIFVDGSTPVSSPSIHVVCAYPGRAVPSVWKASQGIG